MTDFIKAGISAGLSFVRSQVSRADSSDEEGDFEPVVAEGYVSSKAGITFEIGDNKTNKPRSLHINLYKGQIQKSDLEGKLKRIYSCYDVQSVIRSSENIITVEIKESMDMTHKQKTFKFFSDLEASKFHQYLEFIIEFGQIIIKMFDEIDYKKTGFINKTVLNKALAKVDLKASDEDLTNM
jgi:hypothetical protein